MRQQMNASKHYNHSAHKGRKLIELIINKFKQKKRKLKPLDMNKSNWSI